MNAANEFVDSVKRLWSFAVGLRVTGSTFTQPLITVHYPRRTVENLPAFRGHVELVGKPKDPAKPKCIACMMCVTACPSSCIKVVKAKPPKVEAKEGEEPKKPKPVKEPAKWALDFNLCSLCGTCVEVCPVDSLRYSDDVYLASSNKNDFKFDLMARLNKQAAKA